LRPLGETLGTEALGIDLSKPLDAETFAWVEDAFAEHPVLAARGGQLRGNLRPPCSRSPLWAGSAPVPAPFEISNQASLHC